MYSSPDKELSDEVLTLRRGTTTVGFWAAKSGVHVGFWAAKRGVTLGLRQSWAAKGGLTRLVVGVWAATYTRDLQVLGSQVWTWTYARGPSVDCRVAAKCGLTLVVFRFWAAKCGLTLGVFWAQLSSGSGQRSELLTPWFWAAKCGLTLQACIHYIHRGWATDVGGPKLAWQPNVSKNGCQLFSCLPSLFSITSLTCLLRCTILFHSTHTFNHNHTLHPYTHSTKTYSLQHSDFSK